jgi:uncharacterized protein YggU (UPF0235/DUF167 family)
MGAMTRLTVHVKPGSRRGPAVETGEDGSLTAFVRERAVDGAANVGVIALLATHFGVARSRVTIARGHTSRTKLVDVDLD